jgi:hypothetical protein
MGATIALGAQMRSQAFQAYHAEINVSCSPAASVASIRA